MAIAKLFRFTVAGDTPDVGSIGPGNINEFNLQAVTPDDTGRLTTPAFRMTRDTNIHPNPRRVLDQIQDSLLGIFELTLHGYFTSHQATLGTRNLFNWQVGDAINTEFTAGRFGLVLDSFNSILNLTPTGVTAEGIDPADKPKGYVLYDIDIQDAEAPRDKVPFVLKLYRNGDISEITIP